LPRADLTLAPGADGVDGGGGLVDDRSLIARANVNIATMPAQRARLGERGKNRLASAAPRRGLEAAFRRRNRMTGSAGCRKALRGESAAAVPATGHFQ
jgi:hypothetical protein